MKGAELRKRLEAFHSFLKSEAQSGGNPYAGALEGAPGMRRARLVDEAKYEARWAILDEFESTFKLEKTPR